MIMAIKQNREYRYFAIPLTRAARSVEDEQENIKEYRVEGYASTFTPYVLWTDTERNVDYVEQVDTHAFDDADMSDVIFLYNHEGMVYARQKNGTLELSVDDKGLKVVADLSSTEESRKMYDAIDKGLIDQMSFAFTIADDEYDKETHTRTIKRIGKVYDVSAVSIPANTGTDISAVSARDYVHGVMDMERAERLAREKRIALAKAIYHYRTVGR